MTVRQILSDVPVYTVKSVPYTLGDGSFHTGADTPFFVLLIDIAPLPDRYSICNVDCSLTRRKPLVKSFFEFSQKFFRLIFTNRKAQLCANLQKICIIYTERENGSAHPFQAKEKPENFLYSRIFTAERGQESRQTIRQRIIFPVLSAFLS